MSQPEDAEEMSPIEAALSCPVCGELLQEFEETDATGTIHPRWYCPRCGYTEGPENHWGEDALLRE